MNSKSDMDILGEASDLFEAGRFEESLKLFKELASRGDGRAMSRIALFYSEGTGVDVDMDESIKWDLLAIEHGDETSLENLALSYCSLRRFREGRVWFERAVAAGNGDAAVELAKLLSVSDREKEVIRHLLKIAVSHDSICESSRDEARQMLDELERNP